jgi:hypothetical protein
MRFDALRRSQAHRSGAVAVKVTLLQNGPLQQQDDDNASEIRSGRIVFFLE